MTTEPTEPTHLLLVPWDPESIETIADLDHRERMIRYALPKWCDVLILCGGRGSPILIPLADSTPPTDDELMQRVRNRLGIGGWAAPRAIDEDDDDEQVNE